MQRAQHVVEVSMRPVTAAALLISLPEKGKDRWLRPLCIHVVAAPHHCAESAQAYEG